MTVEDFICRLEEVRRTGRGASARCPAHVDRHPSLSVIAGDRGILIRCHAGCSAQEICTSLGLSLRDLFYSRTIDQFARRTAAIQKQKSKRVGNVIGLRADLLRDATVLVKSAQGICIDGWSDDQLNFAMNRLADAYDFLEGENG